MGSNQPKAHLAPGSLIKPLLNTAIVKLTAAYAVILLAVSLVFSVSFYQVSIRELDSNMRGQARALGGYNSMIDRQTQLSILEDISLGNIESRERLFNRLILGNAIMLGGSILLSYIFAKKTLEPISEAHEAQSRFTSDASHELRTPLAVMQTEIDVALRDKSLTKQDAIDLLKSTRQEVTNLSKLTSNLLALARQSRPQDLNIATVVVADLAKDIVNKHNSGLKQKSQQISVEIDPKHKALADPHILAEILSIVIDNASKYSPDNSTITISSRSSTRSIRLIIEDQGKGLDKQELERVFDRFYRADKSRHSEGYGLGLSIAKQLVETLEGDIEACSDGRGKGTKFIIRLPKA